MKTIIYLKSTNDPAEKEALNYLKVKTQENGYSLEILFLLELQKEEPPYLEKWISYFDLLQYLEKKITELNVEHIALHLGIAFDFFPSVILQTLAVIKERHPLIKFTYEPKKGFEDTMPHMYYRGVYSGNYRTVRESQQYILVGRNQIFDQDIDIISLLWN